MCENSSKLVDVQSFLEKHKPHLLCITEADIHGPNSRINRRQNFTTEDINEKLKIPDYSIKLPDSWKTHDQARLIVFVSDDIKATIL